MRTLIKRNPPNGHSLASLETQDDLKLHAVLPLFIGLLQKLAPFVRRQFTLLALACMSMALLAACTTEDKRESALQEKKDAIMATIEEETNAFFARDYERWKATYVQEDYAFQAWSNRDGTFDSSVGWEGIDNSVGRYIHENPIPETDQATTVERKNIKFKFYGDDVAYLTWDQFNSDREGALFFHSKEVRLLEKVGNEWKIVCVSAFWDFKNLIPADKLPEIQRMDKESRGLDKI